MVDWLPRSLPAEPKVLWRTPMTSKGLAGVAATEDLVIVADREDGDTTDCFRALDAKTGKERWAVKNIAQGRLDYGNSPRATPLIVGDRVFLYGAFGDLQCVELATGRVVWQKNLKLDFGAFDDLIWGTTSSPLVVDGKLIVNPGSPLASLAALKPETGEPIWQTAGGPAAFASFVLASPHGKRQLIGYDKPSLGGWDPESGQRLWELVPDAPDDFNVPTPLVYKDRLIVSTENNGTRMYGFDEAGRILPKPLAVNEDLAPDTHTPVILGNRLFGIWEGLHCLDLENGLKSLWTSEEEEFTQYGTLIASPDRLLALTVDGQLLLFDPQTNTPNPRPLARTKLFQKESGCYSHPAIVGKTLFIRGSKEILAIAMQEE